MSPLSKTSRPDIQYPGVAIAPSACSGCTTWPLSCLKPGTRGTVTGVAGERESRRRLLEMGFCNNTSVEMIRRAPFGDPIEFRLRGYFVSLRGDQAQNVIVTPVADVGH